MDKLPGFYVEMYQRWAFAYLMVLISIRAEG